MRLTGVAGADAAAERVAAGVDVDHVLGGAGRVRRGAGGRAGGAAGRRGAPLRRAAARRRRRARRLPRAAQGALPLPRGEQREPTVSSTFHFPHIKEIKMIDTPLK